MTAMTEGPPVRSRRPAALLLVVSMMAVFAIAPRAARAEIAETVRGKVSRELRDGSTVPVRGLRVELRQTEDDSRVAASYTSRSGLFHFSDIPFGRYELVVGEQGERHRYVVRVSEAPITDLPPVVLRR